MAERGEGPPAKKSNPPKRGGGSKENQGKKNGDKEKKDQKVQIERFTENEIEALGHVRRRLLDQLGKFSPEQEKIINAAVEQQLAGSSEDQIRKVKGLFKESLQRGERSLNIEEEQKIRYGTYDDKWEAIDAILSEIYATADATPEEHFNACFTLEQQIKMSEIRRQVMLSEEHSDLLIARLNAVHSMRETVHNAMFLVEGAKGGVEDMKRMMQAPSGLVDVLFDQPGVGAAHRFYEDILERERTRNNNWIPPEFWTYSTKGQKCAVDVEVRRLFKEALKAGAVDGIKYKEEDIGKKEGKWAGWKINRALHLGRAYGAVSARFIEISAQTRAPGSLKEGFRDRMLGPFAEDFVRCFNPIENMIRRFDAGRNLNYVYFLLTGESREFKDPGELRKEFDKLMILHPEKKELKQIWNLFQISGPSGNAWRVYQAQKAIPKEDKKFIGIQAELFDLDGEQSDRLEAIDNKKATESEKDAEKDIVKREILVRKQEAWDRALQRVPLAVLRGVLRGYPEMQGEINKRVFGKENVDRTILDKIEEQLFILKEQAVSQKKITLDFSLIKEPGLRRQTEQYAQAIRKIIWEKGLLGGNLTDLGNDKREIKTVGLLDGDMLKKFFPHTVAVSDMAFEKFQHIRDGQIGFLARRWRDIFGASKAMGGFLGLIGEMPRLKKVDDYKKVMKVIWDGVNEIDHNYAQELTGHMAKMICLGNQKLPLDQLLPAPAEWLLDPFGLRERPRSYVQKIFGSDAAVWDKINIRRFIESLATEDYIDEEHDAKDLYKKLGATRGHVIAEAFIRWGPAAIFVALAFLANELKKQLEEELKKG